ncbi:MAG: hypothetical protein DMF91_04865 [Acidobacteria bacterium]|nr:MAG: hypothetical protein DMF91_04865 [Acidobacteriota bacterium]
MRIAKQVGLVVAGAVVGVLVMTSIRAQAQPEPAAPRLVFKRLTTSDQSAAYLVRDTAGGCYLAAAGGLAPAPEHMCWPQNFPK